MICPECKIKEGEGLYDLDHLPDCPVLLKIQKEALSKYAGFHKLHKLLFEDMIEPNEIYEKNMRQVLGMTPDEPFINMWDHFDAAAVVLADAYATMKDMEFKNGKL